MLTGHNMRKAAVFIKKKKKGLESRDIWKSLNDDQTMAEPVFLSLQEWAPALLVTKTAGPKTEPFVNDIDLQK